jgi:hypothetical protein
VEDYPEIITPARALLLPDDFWRLIQKLAYSESDRPAARITEKQFPDYCSPQSKNRTAFNTGLGLLSNAGVCRVVWESNASRFATQVQLLGGREPLLTLLRRHHPELLRLEKAEREIPHGPIYQVLERYGPLGLRTASHLAFGDSHRLESIDITKMGIANLWAQPDVIVQGSSVVRIAGRFRLDGTTFTCKDTWTPPGHILWRWQLDEVGRASITTGSRLMLIENPYPYWELVKRWAGEDITFICLHGETRHGSIVESDAALPVLLAKIFENAPGLSTGIWCDPDPGGLAIASHAYNLVKQSGGQPFFVGMVEETVEWIRAIVLSELPFLKLEEKERAELESSNYHPFLHKLRNWMLESGTKGEQEGLVILEEEIKKQILFR